MPKVKCIRRCWDSQKTQRYYPGNIADLPSDHPLVKAKCFEVEEETREMHFPSDAKLGRREK